jgi:hypothetical protein
MHCLQYCFICRPSYSTVSEDAGIEPRTVATSALAVRRTNHYRLDLISSRLEHYQEKIWKYTGGCKSQRGLLGEDKCTEYTKVCEEGEKIIKKWGYISLACTVHIGFKRGTELALRRSTSTEIETDITCLAFLKW